MNNLWLPLALCVAGKAVVHTYTAGNEPYSVWEGLERGSKEYEDLKQQRAETLWKVGGLGSHCERGDTHIRVQAYLLLCGTKLPQDQGPAERKSSATI